MMPVFLKLEGRRVLVVGAGPVGASKVLPLVAAGAEVHVVAPEIHASIRARDVTIHERPFAAADLDDAWFVISAAPPEVNRAVAREAELRRIFVIAVDDIDVCTAFGAGVVKRGGITLAISSAGTAPGLVRLVRQALENLLPEDLDQWTRVAESARRHWKAAGTPMAARVPLLLTALNELYEREAS